MLRCACGNSSGCASGRVREISRIISRSRGLVTSIASRYSARPSSFSESSLSRSIGLSMSSRTSSSDGSTTSVKGLSTATASPPYASRRVPRTRTGGCAPPVRLPMVLHGARRGPDRVFRREHTVGRQLVDHVGQRLAELLGRLVDADPRLVGDRLQVRGIGRLLDLVGGDWLVLPLAHPRVEDVGKPCIARSLLELLERERSLSDHAGDALDDVVRDAGGLEKAGEGLCQTHPCPLSSEVPLAR